MIYRAYCQDEALEIVDDPNLQSITGLIPQLTLCVCNSDVQSPVSAMKAIPPSSRTMEIDPFVSGLRKYTVACADRVQRSYADKQPHIAVKWAKGGMKCVPSLTLQQTILRRSPSIFPSLLSCFLNIPCRITKLIHNSILPGVIRNKILPSMNESSNTRTVLETAEEQDVFEHNIPARANIIVNPRNARTPKHSAATKRVLFFKSSS